mmetsp:Transcript_3146/g.2987  ORF Transcript_3146/g.2987 Transcript_3146/m.2987 type:complete len:89 (+) Transcript_3146:51-317(+)
MRQCTLAADERKMPIDFRRSYRSAKFNVLVVSSAAMLLAIVDNKVGSATIKTDILSVDPRFRHSFRSSSPTSANTQSAFTASLSKAAN